MQANTDLYFRYPEGGKVRHHLKQYLMRSLLMYNLMVERKKETTTSILPSLLWMCVGLWVRDMSFCVWLCIMPATWLLKCVTCMCALLQHCVSPGYVIISWDIHLLC